MLRLCLLLCLLLCGCGKGRIVLTTGFGEDEVFRVEDEHCSRAEVLVYLTNLHSQYESAFGSGIWQAKAGDTDLEQSVKQTVLARLAKIKLMNIMAGLHQVSLDKEEERKAAEAASAYYQSLSPEEIAVMDGVNEEQIRMMYEEYAVADKLYRVLTQDVDTEISDDEARIVTLHQLVLYCDSRTEEAQLRLAEELRERCVAGEDFDSLAHNYSEAEDLTLLLAKGQEAPLIEQTGFSLAEGELSSPVVTEKAVYLFRCISTHDREQTEERKKLLAEKRKKEAFDARYDEFAGSRECHLNEELWNGIEPVTGEGIDTADFFDVYERYFAR